MSSQNSIPRRNPSPVSKQFNRKPSYLERLPFWKRYPRTFVLTGGLLTFCIVYSAPIYYFFREPPENADPRSTMWPSEIQQGMTHAQKFRLRMEKKMQEEEALKLKKAEEAKVATT